MKYLLYPLLAALIQGRPLKEHWWPAFFAAATTSMLLCIEDNVPVLFDLPAYIRSLF